MLKDLPLIVQWIISRCVPPIKVDKGAMLTGIKAADKVSVLMVILLAIVMLSHVETQIMAINMQQLLKVAEAIIPVVTTADMAVIIPIRIQVLHHLPLRIILLLLILLHHLLIALPHLVVVEAVVVAVVVIHLVAVVAVDTPVAGVVAKKNILTNIKSII